MLAVGIDQMSRQKLTHIMRLLPPPPPQSCHFPRRNYATAKELGFSWETAEIIIDWWWYYVTWHVLIPLFLLLSLFLSFDIKAWEEGEYYRHACHTSIGDNRLLSFQIKTASDLNENNSQTVIQRVNNRQQQQQHLKDFWCFSGNYVVWADLIRFKRLQTTTECR